MIFVKERKAENYPGPVLQGLAHLVVVATHFLVVSYQQYPELVHDFHSAYSG